MLLVVRRIRYRSCSWVRNPFTYREQRACGLG